MKKTELLLNALRDSGTGASCVISLGSGWLLLFVLFFTGTKSIYAQENIPIGTWRTHLSFNSVSFLAAGDAEIFSASENGVMVYSLVEGTTTVYSSLNELSGTGISALAYDKERKQVLVGYATGALDIISEAQTIHFTRLVNPSDVPVTGAINHILIAGAVAYLSTNYGVVLFDLSKNEVKETWRNLGPGGQLIAVNQSALLNESIYLATSNGVLIGDLSNNLLDYNQWTRFATGDFNTSIRLVSTYNQQVYVAIDQVGLFRYSAGVWVKELSYPILNAYAFLQGEDASLLFGGGAFFYSVNGTGMVSSIVDGLLVSPQAALLQDGKYWVADSSTGLLSNTAGAWKAYLTNGPFSPIITSTKYTRGAMHALHGGVDEDFVSSNSLEGISKFTNGLWGFLTTQVNYVTDVESGSGETFYISSFGEGLEKMAVDGSSIILNGSNSPLLKVTALENSSSGLWIANYGAAQSLHLLNSTDQLQSFSFTSSASRYPFELAEDGSGNIWMLISPAGGGGIFIVKKDGSPLRYLTDLQGAGLLPSKEVLSVAVDKQDYVWVGTAKGVVYYTYAEEDGIRPIVEGRFLLSEERVTALAVDGGNRKWIGTERGVWLFNDSGEELVYNFTTQNSPLLSNKIVDIEIEEQSGEVFITTDKGLISFRSDATAGKVSSEEVKIFPNPVNPGFSGVVGISNLFTDALVKIVDVSGKLVNQLQANGGTASWNMIDYTGKRVGSGVYLVIASAPDGSESVAGKIVVVD